MTRNNVQIILLALGILQLREADRANARGGEEERENTGRSALVSDHIQSSSSS